jgi:hypothetical protein
MRWAGCLWLIAVIAAACGSNSPVREEGSAAAGGAGGRATSAGSAGSAGADAGSAATDAGGAGTDAGSTGTDAGSAGAGSDGAAHEAPTQHRPVATPCPTDRSAPTCEHVAVGSPLPPGGNCTQDADCKSGQNGRCVSSSPNLGSCDVCSYDECFADGDCSGGGPCDCRSSFATAAANVCSAGNCRVDADCGPGGYCSPSLSRCDYPGVETATTGYFCRTSKDTCIEDDDCKKPTVSQQCRYDGAAGLWRCIDYPGCPT